MARKKRIRRRFNLVRIKQQGYFIGEICDLFGIHKNTVRQWIRAGLPTVDDVRPILILGEALRAFLAARQNARKCRCEKDQMYCTGCRQPCRVLDGIVMLTPRNAKSVNLRGRCEEKQHSMCKTVSIRNLPELAKIFIIQEEHKPHIAESFSTTPTCH